MLLIILLLPVEEIAKTAGAFQIVVYILVNIALIAFRVRKPAWYKPKYKSPAYPWIQIFGVLSGVVVLSQMDTLPIIGGVGILIFGTIWFFLYGRKRVERRSIIADAIAERIEAEPADKPYRIIVPIANPATQQHLLRIAAAAAESREKSEIIAVNVITMPDQTSLAQAVEFEDERIKRHEQLMEKAEAAIGNYNTELRTRVVIGRSVEKIIINLLKKEQADEVILGWKGERKRREFILGSIIDPIVKEAPSKVTLVKQRYEKIGATAVFIGTGPHTHAAVSRAIELTDSEKDTSLTLINIQDLDQYENREDAIRAGEMLIAKAVDEAGISDRNFEQKVMVTQKVNDDLIIEANNYDTTCIGATRSSRLESALFGSFPELVGEKVRGNVLIVRGKEKTFYSAWHIVQRLFKRG